MGAGIAKQIKDRYPMAYESDCYAMAEDEVGLGSFSFAWTDANQTKGIYTQDKIGQGREVDYEGFYVSLENANHIEWQSNHEEETNTRATI